VITGRIGVYVFFTLSGFLITTLLLSELHGSGRIRLGGFYGRRARRLLPALALVVIAVLAFGHLVPDATSFRPGRDVVVSVALYFANWFMIARPSVSMGAFGHMWSLAVEEQFYLVWPIVVIAVARWRQRLDLLLPICIAGSVGAVFARWYVITHGANLDHLLVGTDTNADQLLLGCALAVVIAGATDERRGRIRSTLSRLVWPAIAYLLYMLFIDAHIAQGGRPALAYPIMQFVLGASSMVVIGHIYLSTKATIARTLSLRPLVRLGEISYGWYLWHVPVFTALRYYLQPYDRYTALALCCVITYVLASLSYRFVEMPIRRGFGGNRRVRLAVAA
jgi:peptidoglycan/LPS O-acetylase OafA/YrhL